jgi:hypothetical protein
MFESLPRKWITNDCCRAGAWGSCAAEARRKPMRMASHLKLTLTFFERRLPARGACPRGPSAVNPYSRSRHPVGAATVPVGSKRRQPTRRSTDDSTPHCGVRGAEVTAPTYAPVCGGPLQKANGWGPTWSHQARRAMPSSTSAPRPMHHLEAQATMNAHRRRECTLVVLHPWEHTEVDWGRPGCRPGSTTPAAATAAGCWGERGRGVVGALPRDRRPRGRQAGERGPAADPLRVGCKAPRARRRDGRRRAGRPSVLTRRSNGPGDSLPGPCAGSAAPVKRAPGSGT